MSWKLKIKQIFCRHKDYMVADHRVEMRSGGMQKVTVYECWCPTCGKNWEKIVCH